MEKKTKTVMKTILLSLLLLISCESEKRVEVSPSYSTGDVVKLKLGQEAIIIHAHNGFKVYEREEHIRTRAPWYTVRLKYLSGWIQGNVHEYIGEYEIEKKLR